jgi:hypothetical protein
MSDTVLRAKAYRLKSILERRPDDKSLAPVRAALARVRSASEDLDQRRTTLAASGHFTSIGIFDQLKPQRLEHAKDLRANLDNLRRHAEPLLAARTPKEPTLPADADRLLAWWTSLPAAERGPALAKAMGGGDADLRAVLSSSRFERYVNLTPSTLAALRTQPDDDIDVELAEALALAAHEVQITLATLEGGAQ